MPIIHIVFHARATGPFVIECVEASGLHAARYFKLVFFFTILFECNCKHTVL